MRMLSKDDMKVFRLSITVGSVAHSYYYVWQSAQDHSYYSCRLILRGRAIIDCVIDHSLIFLILHTEVSVTLSAKWEGTNCSQS